MHCAPWIPPHRPPTVLQARRVAEANLSFILDLHYSDWWADPLHQAKPLAWQERATHPPLVVVIPSLLPATEVPLSSLSALGIATAGAETHPPRLYPPHRRRLCGAGYAACGGAGPCIRAHVRRTVHEQRDCWPALLPRLATRSLLGCCGSDPARRVRAAAGSRAPATYLAARSTSPPGAGSVLWWTRACEG